MRAYLLYLLLSLACGLSGQDTYTGTFSPDEFYRNTSTELPVGFHRAYDADRQLTIVIRYGEHGAIDSLAAGRGEGTVSDLGVSLPADDIEWIPIVEGLWINAAGGVPRHTTFDPKQEFLLHYAGFLEDGTPFDNSFIRNRPLQGRLEYLIEGFSLGAANVAPGTARLIRIAPELGYGDNPAANIPAGSTLYYLIYNLELHRAR